ncbi:calcium-binding mitochondrial carrier Sal1p [Trichomonascus vanleenenianus]|uniref:Ca(2+)-binding ATP:ADP antiporter SAL1 n=1 Tax=Trichomonascus vanleenenianus TaxID=2268995 RepID=UPI003ECB7C89
MSQHIIHAQGDNILEECIGPELSKQREERYKQLFNSLDTNKNHVLDASDLTKLLEDRYQPLDNLDEIVEQLYCTISKSDNGLIDFERFKQYMAETEHILEKTFETLDTKKDGRLDFYEIKNGFEKLDLHVSEENVRLFFNTLDTDEDGYISLYDWKHNLIFIPNQAGSPLKAAYLFFIEELDLSSEGDVFVSSETLHGVGYFLAGGLAGVVSRTCTAPFDRLKVYLIAQSGSVKSMAKATGGSALKTAAEGGVKSAIEGATKAVTSESPTTIGGAIRHLWRQGGVRSFFVGNGLNVIKVFPESAMKFGSFEFAKRFLCRLEGVPDTSELSRGATFLAGGIGGMVSQFTIYPIDTLKFRVQCEAQYSSKRGNQLLKETVRKMLNDGGLSIFYRGLWVGVCGIFPFAALDLGTFSAMKKAYVASQARTQGVDPADVELNNMAVLTMGALSGSVGASVVYPINLLRTRLQAQGTTAHPYTYTGFTDVFQKTVARDGYKGLFRGLGPNLAKVAPAVSISYLVYENAKATMNLS